MTVTLPVLLFAIVCLQVQSADIVYKVTTIQQDPFIVATNVSDGRTRYEGFLIDLLDQLRSELQVDFTISRVPDGQYGSLHPDGTWKGMIGQLVRGEADIAAAPLIVTAMRSTVVDFSYPFMMSGPQILMKKPRRVTPLIPTMFSTEVWICLAIAYVAVSVSVYIISRWSPFEWRQTESEDRAKETFNFSNSWLYTASTLLWQGYGVSPKSFSGRMLSVFWWSFVFLILASYIASQTGRFIMNNPTFESGRISTFQELADLDIPYGTIKGGSTEAMFRNSKDPLKAKMWRSMSGTPSGMVNTFSEGVDRVSKYGYAFITEQAIFVARRPCNIYVVEERLANRGLAFAVRINLGILQKLNQALLKMQEDERLEFLKKKWFSGECDEDKEPRVHKPHKFTITIVTLKDTAFAFILLAIGIVASVLACVVENCLNQRGILVPSSSQKKNEKQSRGDDTTE